MLSIICEWEKILKILIIICLLFLTGCSVKPNGTLPVITYDIETTTIESQVETKESKLEIIDDLDYIKNYTKGKQHINYVSNHVFLMVKYTGSNLEVVGDKKDNWFNDTYFYVPPIQVGEYIIIQFPSEYNGEVYLKDGEYFILLREEVQKNDSNN